jgi:hypothetical protein
VGSQIGKGGGTGTEFGVFVTIDGGAHWAQFKGNFPTAGVRGMVIQPRAQELVLGSYGRSIWIVDMAPLQQLTLDVLSSEAHLFDVKPGVLFRTRYTYGATIEQLNGDMCFRGENPPFGTMITYYLRDDRDHDVTLAITDEQGNAVRSLTGPGTAGLHRINWNLQPDDPEVTSYAATASEREFQLRVTPGTYTVTLQLGGTAISQQIAVISEGDEVRRNVIRK